MRLHPVAPAVAGAALPAVRPPRPSLAHRRLTRPMQTYGGQVDLKGKGRQVYTERPCYVEHAEVARHAKFASIRWDFIRENQCRTRSVPLNGKDNSARQERSYFRQQQAFAERSAFRISPSFLMFRRSLASSATVPHRRSAHYNVVQPQVTGEESESEDQELLSQLRVQLAVPEGQFDANDAWDTYEAMRKRHITHIISDEELLSLGEKLAGSACVLLGQEDAEVKSYMEWGERLQKILEDLKKKSRESSVLETFAVRCLTGQSTALNGFLVNAQQHALALDARSSGRGASHRIALTFKLLLLSICRYGGPRPALDFFLQHTDRFSDPALRNHFSMKMRHGEFYQQLACVVAAIPTPVAAFLTQSAPAWDTARLQYATEAILWVLCQERRPHEAFRVWEEAQELGLSLRLRAQLDVINICLSGAHMEEATHVFAALPSEYDINTENRAYHQVALRLFARQGDVPRAEEHFKWLEDANALHLRFVNLVMQASAVGGEKDRVVELWEKFFPDDLTQSPLLPNELRGRPLPDSTLQAIKPNIHLYNTIMLAFLRAQDVEGMNLWYERMQQDGIQPDRAVYNIILQGLVMLGDLEGIHMVMEQTRRSRVKPDKVSYTIVLDFLARRKDPLAAEALYKRALREGIKPDTKMISALMNAHAEAGSHKGVIRAFDYLKHIPARQLNVDIKICNVLLKSYVFLGTPYEVVARVYHRIQASRLKPNVRTYALLIQSACDSNEMHVANNLYAEMVLLEETQWQANIKVNVYVMTIMMIAYLRQGYRNRAKAVYDEMTTRGVQPSMGTLSAILQSYSKSMTPQSIEAAEKFLKQLLSPAAEKEAPSVQIDTSAGGAPEVLSDKPLADEVEAPEPRTDESPSEGAETQADETGAESVSQEVEIDSEPSTEKLAMSLPVAERQAILERLHVPLMNAYAKGLQPSEVERLLTQMLDAGAEPSISSLTVLLDAYRRTEDIPAIRSLWPQIHKLGLSFSAPDILLQPEDINRRFYKSQRRLNVLCLPLSVYIDAMSRAGYHTEVARTWADLRKSGFQFDSHNWNHLAIALVRAGHPARAFEVVERVILPYQDKARAYSRERERHVDSPLVFDGTDATSDQSESTEADASPTNDMPEPGLESTHDKARRAQMAQQTHWHARDNARPNPNAGDDADDLALPLHILQQLSPAWNFWRAHGETLRVLGRALRRLEGGMTVRPVLPEGEEPAGPAQPIDVQQREAEYALRHIWEKSPRAVQVVMEWMRRQENLGHRSYYAGQL